MTTEMSLGSQPGGRGDSGILTAGSPSGNDRGLPTVSVIIAAYNAAAYVGAAIASAQAQTLGNIEIIVVDDASTDATRTIAGSYAAADPRVSLVSLPVNGGPGNARNAALTRASGEWVTMLDADDTYDPCRLERLLALAADTGAEMVADNLILQHANGVQTLLRGTDYGQRFEIDALSYIAANRGRRNQGRVLYGFLVPMIRRSLLARSGIAFRNIRLAEDYFFVLECLMHGARWVVTHAPMYHYLMRSDSLTATFMPDDLDAIAQIDRLLLDEPEPRANGRLQAAIAGHLRAVTRAATWTRFVYAVRARDLRSAAQVTFVDANAVWDVFREGIAALPRVLCRVTALILG